MPHITLDAFTKTHPHNLTYAAKWEGLLKQPGDAKFVVIVLLIASVITAYILGRGILRGFGLIR